MNGSTRLMDLLAIRGTFPCVRLFTVILSIQLLACSGIHDPKKSPECNKPFQCGIIEILSYPFRQRGSPDYCGKPGFELYCSNDNPMIRISSIAYHVLVYNTTLRSITVAPELGVTDLLCGLFDLLDTTVDLTPFRSAWNTVNITLYNDCPISVTRIIELYNHKINCSAGVNYFLGTPSFYNLSAEAKDGLTRCRRISVPVFASILQVLEHSPSVANLEVTLSNGFGLQWSEDDSLSGSKSMSK